MRNFRQRTGGWQVECNLAARIFTGTSGPNAQMIGPPETIGPPGTPEFI